MKEGYKKCPYCANEIKEGAKKCMYCREYLTSGDVSENNKVTNIIDNKVTNNEVRPRYKNAGFWVIIGISALIIGPTIYQKINNIKYQNARNQYYNKIIENNGEVSVNDITDYLDSSRGISQDREYQQAMDELNSIVTNYNDKINSLGNLFIEENYDLKNITKLNNIISDWKGYKLYSEQYLDNVTKFFDKYKSQLINVNPNTPYSMEGVINEISKLVGGIKKRSDTNIELYSYILSIQNDFYIDDGSVFFYQGTQSTNKYNSLWENREKEYNTFTELYNQYTAFLVEYAKYSKK